MNLEMPLKRSQVNPVFSVNASIPMVDIRVLALITDFFEILWTPQEPDFVKKEYLTKPNLCCEVSSDLCKKPSFWT